MQIVKKSKVDTGAEVSSSYTLYMSSAEVSAFLVLLGVIFGLNYGPEVPSSLKEAIKAQFTECEQLILVRMMWSLMRQI